MGGFGEILGNEQVKQHFQKAIETGRISHCIILSGEEGIGKRMAADAFAQTLLCENREGMEPCGKCHSCQQFAGGNHPDVLYPSHEKPATFGVDDVREGIVKDILIKPYASKWKVYIVDEAQKLTAAAQNALLKTIEEPPAYGIILLLTTNASGLLETIRSRSVVLSMKPVTREDFEKKLRAEGVEEEKLEQLYRFTQGNIGKALKLSSSEDFSELVDLMMRLLRGAGNMSFAELLECIALLERHKLSVKDCFDLMRLWYRDVLVYKATRDPNLLVFSQELVDVSRVAQVSSYGGIEQVIEAIDKASVRLDANVNFPLTMELLWMTIRDCTGTHIEG